MTAYAFSLLFPAFSLHAVGEHCQYTNKASFPALCLMLLKIMAAFIFQTLVHDNSHFKSVANDMCKAIVLKIDAVEVIWADSFLLSTQANPR